MGCDETRWERRGPGAGYGGYGAGYTRRDLQRAGGRDWLMGGLGVGIPVATHEIIIASILSF